MSAESIALATDFAILLLAAAVLSTVARVAKQPTIVAYILTGLLVGPVVFGVVTEDALIEVVAELGLGFLLFLLGIEMSFENVKDILKPVGAIAVGQAILQACLSTAVALGLGFTLFESLVIALATTFGATPIIVKVLSSKNELKSLYGRVDVGVLIFQDIYLIVALAILSVEAAGDPQAIALNVGRVSGLMILVGVVTYLSYKYVLPAILRASADDDRTLFTVAVGWAFLFIYVAEVGGLTVEVGGFFAGLALAQLPYSLEIKERMRPITDFFIVIFFASIGLQMETAQLLAYWQEALIACAVLLAGNFVIVYGLFASQGFDSETSFLGTISMLQVSEFSLVLGALAVDQGFIEADILGFFSLMALVTMTLSTYVIIYNRDIYDRVEPYLERFEREETIDSSVGVHENHAVVVGVDALTDRLLPTLRDHCDEVVLVDRSVEYIEEFADTGKADQNDDIEFVFGDARHADVRQELDLENAAALVSVAERPAVNKRLLEETRGGAIEDPLTIVTANDPETVERLYEQGADYVVATQSLVSDALISLLEDYFENDDAFVDRLETRAASIRGEDDD
ncbi:cation:proton antiporter domain-containing protein [Halostagnicola bangensis]